MPEVIAAKSLHKIIKNKHRVFIQGSTGEPTQLTAALASSPAEKKCVEYVSVSIPGINQFNPAGFHQGAQFITFFQHQGIVDAEQYKSTTHFVPMHYRDIYRYLETCKPFDVLIIQVSPPDEEGNCSLGTSVDFVPALFGRSQIIVAEVNANFPASNNAPSLAFANIDYVINSTQSIFTTIPVPASDTCSAIADHVSTLIDDGSCLQIGVGKLPSAILNKLHNHQALGLHSGLLCDEVKTLIETGVMTGEQKNIDRHQHVCGIALGSTALYPWCAQQASVLFKPVNYTHCVNTIGAIDHFVSINSVIEVDLLGQANAEQINGQQISAVGGLVDFIRGARASAHGRSILALPATALAGNISRIIPRCTISSVSRYDIDVVVSEFGIAHLAGKSTEIRAENIINIASPKFRPELEKYLESQLSKASIR